jgi:tungstate transport system permease protein
MDYFADAFVAALELIFSFDADIYKIVLTSISISLVAASIAALVKKPLERSEKLEKIQE